MCIKQIDGNALIKSNDKALIQQSSHASISIKNPPAKHTYKD
jgi:hypothetical protein